MRPLDRAAGTAGIVAAVLLALQIALALLGYVALPAATPADQLTYIDQHRWAWRVGNILGVLAAATAVVFAAGLAARLRERAPVRGTSALYFAVIGLGLYAFQGVLDWRGGLALAGAATPDQTGAATAWLAVRMVSRALLTTGSGFVGVALVLAGWAALSTRAVGSAAAWIGVAAGALTLARVLPRLDLLTPWAGVATVAFLSWAGRDLLTEFLAAAPART